MEDLQLYEVIIKYVEKVVTEKHGDLKEDNLPLFYDELKKRIIAIKGYDPFELRKRNTPVNRDFLLNLTQGFGEKLDNNHLQPDQNSAD